MSIAIGMGQVMLRRTSKMTWPWGLEVQWVGSVSSGQLECYDGALIAFRRVFVGGEVDVQSDGNGGKGSGRVGESGGHCRIQPTLHFRLPVSDVKKKNEN